MGGALWSRWRSVHGVALTYRFVSYARWSHDGIAAMWSDHIEHGIADDGSPTGIEQAFRFESFQPDQLILWSRWSDHDGARRLRELYRNASKPDQLVALTHDLALVRDNHPVRARAVDLDALHALARNAKHLADLVARWKALPPPVVETPLPPDFPLEVEYDGRKIERRIDARREGCDDTESSLLAQIERDPRDRRPLIVYADWLETYGRPAEADAVRLRYFA